MMSRNPEWHQTDIPPAPRPFNTSLVKRRSRRQHAGSPKAYQYATCGWEKCKASTTFQLPTKSSVELRNVCTRRNTLVSDAPTACYLLLLLLHLRAVRVAVLRQYTSHLSRAWERWVGWGGSGAVIVGLCCNDDLRLRRPQGNREQEGGARNEARLREQGTGWLQKTTLLHARACVCLRLPAAHGLIRRTPPQ